MNNTFIRGRPRLPSFAFQALLALGALTMAPAASAAVNDMAIFEFDLPAISSYDGANTPYPNYVNVATLTLTEDANGVVFHLDPNEDNPGFDNFNANDPYGGSRIERLDIAFVLSPTVLTAPDFNLDWSNVSGAQVEKLEVEATNQDNFDAGYHATYQHIIINFFNPNGNPNTTDFSPRFNVEEVSTWRINNTTVAQFTTAEATTDSNKPNPIFGVISADAFSGNTSNWVAGTATSNMVPEPTNLALLSIGLIGFVMVRRRQAKT